MAPHAAWATLAWVLSIVAGLGIVTGALFLMPAVTAFVGSFFVDEIADAVEREHYPAEPPGHALPLLRALIEGIKTALLALVVYLCALPFLLFAGLGVIILFLANAYLLGREYFELAAMRFRPPDEAKAHAQAPTRLRLPRRPGDRGVRVDPDASISRRRCSPWPSWCTCTSGMSRTSGVELIDVKRTACAKPPTVLPGHLHRSAMMHFSHSGLRARQV